MKKGVNYYLTGLVFLIVICSDCKKLKTIELPVVTTLAISTIGTTTADCGGNVVQDGGETIVGKGVVWGKEHNPTMTSHEGFSNDGKESGSYESHITGLLRNTVYYVRAYATNSAGTNYGNEVNFTTLAESSTVVTSIPANITSNSVSCGGNVTDDGGAIVVERGICWSLDENPITYNSHTSDGTGSDVFSSMITRLTPYSTYYIRSYSRSYMGTSYGNQISFTTLPGPGQGEITFNPALSYNNVSDVDGNSYKTIVIGTQTWMAENLKTTKFRNGDPIPKVTENVAWKNLTSGAYCNYNNEAVFSDRYGRLYNWYAVNDHRNLAPEGWHIPTDTEWITLINFLGGNEIAGGKLKETGTAHWIPLNSDAKNEGGFTALPGGMLSTGNGYTGMGTNVFWWSATEVDSFYSAYWEVSSSYNLINKGGYNKTDGYSVRCIKN